MNTVGSDDYLLRGKIVLPKPLVKDHIKTNVEKTYKTYLLDNGGIKYLNQRRIAKYTQALTTGHNTEQEWGNIKNVLHKAASEALGKRKKSYKKKGLKSRIKILKRKLQKNRKRIINSWLVEHLIVKQNIEKRGTEQDS